MKFSLFLLTGAFSAFCSFAQISFTDGSSLFNDPNVKSGVAMGVADMNGDGLDDIVRLRDASDLIIEFQQPDGGVFTKENYGNIGGGREWSLCIADVDRDGFNDVMAGGAYNRIKMMLLGPDGVDSIYWVPQPNIFLQGSNFADINNDGLVDIFACHDDGVSAVWQNLGNNSWEYNLGLLNAESTVPSDNSGNYGSIWTDYDSDGDLDLYISKCRGGVNDPMDGRRLNLLFENDGNNNFTDVAEARGLRPLAQSWSADFADIDNDGDMDCFIVNHDSISQLYENVNNSFINITAGSGMAAELATYNTGIQGLFEDFDNDGYVDIIATGAVNSFVFRNNGDKTFTSVSAFSVSTPRIHTTAIGDLNNDGFPDLLTGHGNGYNTPSNSVKDRILLNDGNDNNWLKVGLKGEASNSNAIGARVEIYGSWGIQVREVTAGEGYGITNSLDVHFGLGTEAVIDSMVILWPSGEREVICQPQVNTRHYLAEGCNAACGINNFSASASICTGESYYFGSDTLTEAGSYQAVFKRSGGCDSIVALTLAVIDPDATVTTDGNVLSATEGYSYQWYTCGAGLQEIPGATAADYTATEDGSYAVVVMDGSCSSTSECVDIVGTSVAESVFGFRIDLFPNPAKDRLHVRFNQAVEDMEYRVYDLTGAVLREGVVPVSGGLQLDVQFLPSGTYWLELNAAGKAGSIPFVKQ